MHARSGAWRCSDGKGRGARVQCKLLLAATFIICWTLNLHWFVLLGSSEKFTIAFTELLLYRKSTGVILRDAFPALERLCVNGPFEDCKVRMFVKQRRTHGWSSYLPGKNIFIPQHKSSNLYIIVFEVSEKVSDYVLMHSAVACVHKCFAREGHLKSTKNDCLSNSVENTGDAVTCSLH